jgi:hypothetical protein
MALNIMKIYPIMGIKKTLFCVALAAVGTSVNAQTTIVSGEMVDSLTHQGEPNASIRVFKASNMDKPVAMSITDVSGKFKQTITGTGAYIIEFSSTGRRKIRRNVNLTKDGGELNIGTLLVQDDAQQLKGVDVVAQKPLVKMETDKMTYDVQSDNDVNSNTVLEMLRKVPMVVVDGQDNITVNGSGAFKVYVDGKPNIMFSSNPSQIFKSMPASAVKKIEVITNPGAKYDAEGAVGILNLVMSDVGGKKKSVNGYNGNVSAMISNRQHNESLYLSGQQGKLTYSTNVSYFGSSDDNASIVIDRTSTKDGSMNKTQIDQDTKFGFSNASVSLGYEVDSLSTISTTLGYSGFNNKEANHVLEEIYSKSSTPEDKLVYDTQNKNSNPSFDFSIDYQRFFNKERTKNLIISYLFDTSLNKSNRYNYYDTKLSSQSLMTNDFHTISKPHSFDHTIQVDYTTPLTKDQTLNIGSKYISRVNKANTQYYSLLNGVETYNEKASTEYRNAQSILAGYAEYVGNFGKFGTKAGLRYEHTWENVKFLLGKGEDFKKTYGTLVPSVSFTYNISSGMNLGLNYDMRINRPDIYALNPFVEETPTSRSYGNPNLDVTKRHKVSLVFNSFTPKLMVNATLSGAITNGSVEQYTFLEGKVLHSTYGNIVKERTAGMDLFVNYAFTPKSRLMLNGSIAYNHLQANQLGLKNCGWNINAFLNYQQTLPWNLQFSVFTGVQGGRYELQAVSNTLGAAGVALNKDFFKDKLNVSIQYFNVLNGKLKYKQHTFGSTYIQDMTYSRDIQRLSLTLTWKFGNTKRQFQTKSSNIANDFGSSGKNNSQGGAGGLGTGVGM